MLQRLSDWFEHRTGFRKVREALLIEHIPGGARWRYVWGSCLAFVFSIQLITGLLLMTAYSPGDSTAWASVFYIQYMMDFGWLIRGLHHFGSQTMVVLVGVHMLQVVIAGAHLPPREVNWWLGLGLLGCVLGLSLTGYLLPWDQKGYWATQVATNIMGNMPGIGPWLQKVVVGGPVYGHHTLTRFFSLHVAILPPLIIVLLIAHVTVFRRHGVTTPPNVQGEGWFWPDQAFRDMLVGIAIFAVMLGLVIFGHGHPVRVAPTHGNAVQAAAGDDSSLWSRAAHAGRAGRGANLDAPADPAQPYPARPEWYFLFLFQLLKYFPGESEIIGTVLIPSVAGLVLFFVPLLGYGRMRKFGHWAGVAIVCLMLTSIATLTLLAVAADRADTAEAKQLRNEQDKAEVRAARAVQLATAGIPADGPVQLLRRDPLTRGAVVFGETCGGCHRIRGQFEIGEKASDLAGYGTEQRIHRLIMNPGHDDFFGLTGLNRMTQWAEDENLAEADDETKSRIATIAKWLGAHPRKTSPLRTEEFYKNGVTAFQDMGCNDCHTHEEVPAGTGIFAGPNLTGYGDDVYLRTMIMSPDHPSRYGWRNSMPVFRDLLGPAAEVTQQEMDRIRKLAFDRIPNDPDAESRRQRVHDATRLTHLSDIDRELIIRFLLDDQRVVFGGDPISGPPK